MTPAAIFRLLTCLFLPRIIFAQVALKGVSSSQPPYVLPLIPSSTITSILTAGDAAGGYSMCGTPDGLGAFDNGDGTFTLLMNHEWPAGTGTVHAHGASGAYVSAWTIRKSDLAVTAGADLIRSVNLWNGTAYVSYSPTSPNGSATLQRFCSADLPPVTAFYDQSTGRGTTRRIFMNGEENTIYGRAFAHVVDGPDAGVSWQLPRLGLASWENAVACPFMQGLTIVAVLDDAYPGQVYFYIGSKTPVGNDIERAGLANGDLYGLKVTGYPYESASSTPSAMPFTLENLGNVSFSSGSALDASSNSLSVTNFLRPEDGCWDPAQPSDFYFATTSSYNNNSRLWKVHFADITNPAAGGTITPVLRGGEGQQMLDNVTIDWNGNVLAQEDVGGNNHLGVIWKYNTISKQLVAVARHDSARFYPGGTGFLTIDEESSGIIDVSHILGAGTFLFVSEAHYYQPSPIVEGGQLLCLRMTPDAPLPVAVPAMNRAAVSLRNTGEEWIIESSDGELWSIGVFDVTGHLVKTVMAVPASEQKINPGDLAPGLYLIRIVSASGVSVLRCVR
jgi:hypothetical protein